MDYGFSDNTSAVHVILILASHVQYCNSALVITNTLSSGHADYHNIGDMASVAIATLPTMHSILDQD